MKQATKKIVTEDVIYVTYKNVLFFIARYNFFWLSNLFLLIGGTCNNFTLIFKKIYALIN